MADDGGIGSFRRRIRAMVRAGKEAAAPALLQGGYEVADAIEALAPEDSGDLKGSIAVTPAGMATPPYSQPGGSQVVPENQVAITAGNTDVRYPHLQEYGTRKQAPQPFFWPGFRLSRKRAENRIKRALAKAIREAR